MHITKYLKIFPSPDDPGRLILYSTRRCSVLSVPGDTLRRIEDGTLPEADRDTLVSFGILVEPEREREEILSRFDEANRKGRRFSSVVVLTHECNLACGYCFEEGVRGKRAMSSETAELLVEWIEREQLAKGRKVSLDFYGGEPLLALALIRSIAARLKRSSGDAGLSFDFSMVTNGVLLTRSIAMELKELGLRAAKVTLDGPREVHDLSRPFASGKGSSFDIIVRNIREIADVIGVQIGGNFTRDNYREFPRLLDHLLESGIVPEKVENVVFSPVTGRVGEGAIPDFSSACNSPDEEWYFETVVYLREEILRRGFNTPRPGPAGCMVEFENDIVVGVDGEIYKCPVFVGREGFRVGDLQSGMADDGSLYNPGVWKREECLECAYLPQCFGGCRFMRFLKEGDMKGVECWKGMLDAILERCVLQDLKYRPKKHRSNIDGLAKSQ